MAQGRREDAQFVATLLDLGKSDVGWRMNERAKSEGHATGREVIIRRMKGCGHAFNKKPTGEILVSAKNEAYEFAVYILKEGQGVST